MVAAMSTQPGAGQLQRRVRRVLLPAVKAMWNVELTGLDRLPVDGPAILCPNHISFFDSALLGLTLHRNVSFIGKAEYMDSWKTKRLFPALGMIPIDRSGGDKSTAALEAATRVLEDGELLCVYPEGTRSRTGHLHKGRTGAARLATRVGCPIVPVGITGTDAIQPPGARFPRPKGSCSVHIGRPVYPDRYAARGAEHLVWRSMTDEVMFEIREMTNQEYRPHYAGAGPDAAGSDAGTDRMAVVIEMPAASIPQPSRSRLAAVGS